MVVVGMDVVARGLVILCDHGGSGIGVSMGCRWLPTCRHVGEGAAKGLSGKFLNSNGMTTGQLGAHHTSCLETLGQLDSGERGAGEKQAPAEANGQVSVLGRGRSRSVRRARSTAARVWRESERERQKS